MKKNQKNIQSLKRQKERILETLEEKVDEAKEVLIDKMEERDTISITIDPAKLEKSELREAYIATFDQNLAIVLENVDKQNAYISNLQKEADKKVEELDSQILLIQTKLTLLKVK